MPGQQFIFSIVFISLGVILGWFSHVFYDSLNANMITPEIRPAIISAITLSDPVNGQIPLSVLAEDKAETEDEVSRHYFISLLTQQQFDNALQWYKKAEVKNATLLMTDLTHYINQQIVHKNKQVLSLLEIFLAEYYDDSQLLQQQARAYLAFSNISAALDAFLLARNYAPDNDSYAVINLALHDFSLTVYQQYKADEQWQASIDFFKKLIELEPQFAFYHLALAESYLNVNDKEQAQNHLQNITEDHKYGPQAVEMLEKMFAAESSNAIKLEQSNGHYIINLLIADVYPVKLMLDTGASYSSLSTKRIAQLVQDGQAVKTGRKLIYTAGGKINADLYQLNKIVLGDFIINDIIVVELDLESSLEKNSAFEGLLGINILNQFDFSVDQKSKYLLLSPKKP